MGLSEKQQALFDSMMRKKGAIAASEDNIGRTPDDTSVRLTHQQEGMWFLEQLNPGLSVYNVPCCARIRGNLDSESLERSLQAIVDRHDALRTKFRVRNGAPFLEIQDKGQFSLTRINFSSLTIDESENQALFVADEECRRPFDLESDSIIRAFLICLAKNDYVLIVVMHHLVTDGWSMGIFLRELEAFYESYLIGRDTDLPVPSIRFLDYAAWLRTWLAGENLDRLCKFWRQNLDGVADIELPRDRRRQVEAQNAGAHSAVALSGALTEKIRSFSKQSRVTRFVTLMAAFRAMLFSYSEQTDQVVGSPLACRNRRELENVIGYFVNVLPLRCDLSGNPTFRELVERERLVGEAVQEHQDMPFAKLVQDLGLSRQDGANPVYQVQFTLLEPKHSPDLLGYGLNVAPNEHKQIGNVRFSPLPIDNAVSKFDIVLLLWDREHGITGTCEFDTDLFDASTIEEMMQRFVTLIRIAMEKPDIKLIDLISRFQVQEDVKMTNSDSVNPDKAPQIRRRKRERHSVTTNSRDWVRTSLLFADSNFPLLIEPNVPGVDLGKWAEIERAYVDELLLEHRALLFRGFSNIDVDAFEKFVVAASNGELLEYKDRTTPREMKGNRVYTSTIHPADETINPHNEGTYWIRWPLRLFFCCQIAAESGGETPLSDVRRVYERLSESTRQKFREKEMMLVRNFNDGFGLPWQEVFQTDNRGAVEAYCAANDIKFEWKPNDRLRTRQIRPAVRSHPMTGEFVWFNHAAFFHYTTLEKNMRESLIDELGMDGLPYSTFYGDGSEIEPEVAEEIRVAYAAETVKFKWQAGDVSLLDNMSISHAREPFKGERDVVVCMTDVYSGKEDESALLAGVN